MAGVVEIAAGTVAEITTGTVAKAALVCVTPVAAIAAVTRVGRGRRGSSKCQTDGQQGGGEQALHQCLSLWIRACCFLLRAKRLSGVVAVSHGADEPSLNGFSWLPSC
jgi:hypothetical protein